MRRVQESGPVGYDDQGRMGGWRSRTEPCSGGKFGIEIPDRNGSTLITGVPTRVTIDTSVPHVHSDSPGSGCEVGGYEVKGYRCGS